MGKLYDRESAPDNVAYLDDYRQSNANEIDYSDFEYLPPEEPMSQEQFYERMKPAAKNVGRNLLLGAALMGAIAALAGKGGETKAAVDCHGEQKVFVPEGSNYSQLAYENVKFDSAVSPEAVTDAIEEMNGTYIAPAGKEITLPETCEKSS